MEGQLQYPKYELFQAPPYCIEAEKRKNAHETDDIPSLNLVISNPSKLLSLYEKLHNDASKSLEVKINSYLMREGDCKMSFLIHLLPFVEEAFVQTVGTEELQSTIRSPLSKDVMSQLVDFEDYAFRCNELTPQITDIFEKIFGETRLNISTIPILKKQTIYPCSTKNVIPVLLVCFVESKKNENYIINLANELFKHCLSILLRTLSTEEEMRQKLQYQAVLQAVQKFCLCLDDINELIRVINSEAKQLTDAQKSSLFLINREDLLLILKNFSATEKITTKPNVKLALGYIIAEHVATTGKILNSQTTNTILSNKNLMEFTGFRTRNLLCFPLKNGHEVIGVMQLCNKRQRHFNHFDEEIANVLSIHCGSAIIQSLKFTQMKHCKIRSQLADKLMITHEGVSTEEAIMKMNCPLIHNYSNFELFTFIPRIIESMESVCYVLKMFESLDFFNTFGIKREIFTKFIMTVQKSCRDVPFHNWMHLFSTGHFAYLCLKHLELVEQGYITDLEALAYLITCLCHDVDYRAANGSFQQTAGDALCSLYSSPGSIMERHRLSQILRILNSEGCNFLEVLDRGKYDLFINLLKDLMLATDLATHFKFYMKQHIMSREGYNSNNPEHRYLLCSFLITCADLSDHTKDWPESKNVAVQLFEEFFGQGDLENIKFKKDPIKMKKAEKIFLPELQVTFLKDICFPLYKILGKMFPPLKDLVIKIRQNQLYWETSKHICLKAMDEGQTCLELLKSDQFEKDVEAAMELVKSQK